MSKTSNDRASSRVTRRGFLVGTAGIAGAAAIGGTGYALAPDRLKRRLGLGPDLYIPDAPEGQVRLVTVRSAARRRDVDLFTAVPAGYGDGRGLPVVVVLHGGTATAADFRPYGLGRFLTQAVRDGAAPFVLAGADGGLLRWEPDPNSADDPQAMVVNEMPRWLSDRGYDASRRALWGWSMGGYGSLRLAEAYPDWPVAAAAFSPAILASDPVFADEQALAPVPLGIWCGLSDPFFKQVRRFTEALPHPPEIATYAEGDHDRYFWNDHTLDAFGFLARRLSG
jgi:S-formylglutathione hydrolase FrmB